MQLTKLGALYRKCCELCPATQIGKKRELEKWIETYYEVQEEKCLWEKCCRQFFPFWKVLWKVLDFPEQYLASSTCCHVIPSPRPQLIGPKLDAWSKVQRPMEQPGTGALPSRSGYCPHRNLWRHRQIDISRLAKAETESSCHHNDRAIVT